MKIILDNLTDLTGWTATGAGSVHGLNGHSQYIAGNNDKSIVMRFEDIGDYVEKIYSQDVTEYSFLIIWIASIKKGNNNYRTTDQYKYKIDLGSGEEFYLPVYDTFSCVKINLKDIDEINKIKIISLEDGEDYLILSYAVVSEDRFPFDLFESVKEQLEFEATFLNIEPIVGNIAGTVNDTFITFASPVKYLQRHCAIKITEGLNTETHVIEKVQPDNKFEFGPLLDGTKLLYTYTNAVVKLIFPVTFGNTQKEIILPSVTIWGFSAGEYKGTNDLDKEIQRVALNGVFLERQVGKYIEWMLTIDCQIMYHYELLDLIATWVRRMIYKRNLWINGQRAYIIQIEKPAELFPTKAETILPKISFAFFVEFSEELYIEQALPATTSTDVEVVISE